MNSVTISPKGGLGNQLFIWAAGYALSKRLGVPLHAEFGSLPDGADGFELDSFDNSITTLRPRPTGLLSFRRRATNGWPQGVGRGMRVQDDLALWGAIPSNKPLFLDGYFQDHRFFEETSADIRNLVTAIASPTPWFQQMADILHRGSGFTALHIRRGDYLQLPAHGVLPPSYYQQAVKKLQEQSAELGPLVVFSHERATPEWLSGLSWAGEVQFLVPPPNSRPLESLVLMSMAHSIVIANSTFSWWAAYLSKSSWVCYPKPWFRDGTLIHPAPPKELWFPTVSR